MSIVLRLSLCLYLMTAPALLQAQQGQGGLQPDVRLLIDISGSMKDSDPENLRGPALELIVRLLPNGARAGVWLFAEEAVELVQHRVVDDAWREEALADVAFIDNSGQLTNIPAALKAATYDIDRLNPGYRTSIILLTDGKVDLSESPMANATAARQVLGELAPQLGATGIPVHTIALSDEADWQFLQALAKTTGGIAERTLSPDDLLRVYIRSLETAAPTARIPVSNRTFLIDDSVQEFTALVFHRGIDATEFALIAPDGTEFPAQADRTGIEWFVSGQFAMATAASPASGEWRLQAPDLAEMRVAVISDLTMDIDPPPASLPAGKRSELGLRLRDKGRVITDPEVLSLFNLSLEIRSPGGQRRVINVSSRYPVPEDGEYRVGLPPFSDAGQHQVMVRVKSETLRRRLPLYVDVYAVADNSGITTRPMFVEEDRLLIPAITMAVILLLAIILGLAIRRRRARRRLAQWEKRAADHAKAANDSGIFSGIVAGPEERDRNP
ncbi:MAG: vWA domain-containing protein [Pseudomonadota bacterium]